MIRAKKIRQQVCFSETENGNLDRKEKIKPERLFLAISLIAGLAFALLQPLFIEPDSSYHFDKAMYISNTVVDRTKVGLSGKIISPPYPFYYCEQHDAKGVYFEKFLKQNFL